MYENEAYEKIVTLIDFIESKDKPVINYPSVPLTYSEETGMSCKYSLKYIYGCLAPEVEDRYQKLFVLSCLDDWGLVSKSELTEAFK